MRRTPASACCHDSVPCHATPAARRMHHCAACTQARKPACPPPCPGLAGTCATCTASTSRRSASCWASTARSSRLSSSPPRTSPTGSGAGCARCTYARPPSPRRAHTHSLSCHRHPALHCAHTHDSRLAPPPQPLLPPSRCPALHCTYSALSCTHPSPPPRLAGAQADHDGRLFAAGLLPARARLPRFRLAARHRAAAAGAAARLKWRS